MEIIKSVNAKRGSPSGKFSSFRWCVYRRVGSQALLSITFSGRNCPFSMSLQANVVDYEDVANAAGETLTKYVVRVKYINASYDIYKRYSEFKTLYEILKDLVPPDYRFPNKSMFHNNAQATKDRRVRGFDELLQILLSRQPVPTVMERFLGINERKAKSLQIRSKSITMNKVNSGDGLSSNNGTSQPGSDNGTTANNNNSDRADSPHMEPIVIVPEPVHEQSVKEVVYTPEKYKLINQLRKETPQVIMSSLKFTSVIYILLIVLRVVDITNSDFSEILLTMCILSFVVSFLRINALKLTLGGGDRPTDPAPSIAIASTDTAPTATATATAAVAIAAEAATQ